MTSAPDLTGVRVVCPGSFDPVHCGHLDIIGRAAAQFGEVVVSVGGNSTKPGGLFSRDERVALLEEACTRWPNVRVTTFDGLLVDHCRELGATAVVKGLRFSKDFEYELPMAHLNRQMSGLETIFLPTAPEWGAVSSTLVREIAILGGDITPFVPAEVAQRVRDRAHERREARS